MEANMASTLMKKYKFCPLRNSWIYFVLTLSCLLICQMSIQVACAQDDIETITSDVRITHGEQWRYFKGVEKPPRYWAQSGYDASSWSYGMTGLGYGSSLIKTSLNDMKGNYATIYARHEFLIKNIYIVTGMSLSVVCDGPFKAYINGVEVISNNAINNFSAEELDISGFIHELLPGMNVLAIECTNDDIKSNDFTFIPYFDVFEYQGGKAQ